MKEKKGYSQKTIEYIEHNPDLNILELSIKRKKEFITNASKINNDLDHIICNECGSIFEIKNNTIEDAITKECNQLSFIPEYRSLHIYGQCHRCQKVN